MPSNTKEKISSLAALLEGLAPCPLGKESVIVTGITADSREVKEGIAFVAISGVKMDGNQFVADALAKGAATIITEKTVCPSGCQAAWVTVTDARKALSAIAAKFYQPEPEMLVAVTGTNGKTSVAHFCREIWLACGIKAASIGTLGVVGSAEDSRYPAINTTPDPVLLHRILNELAEEKKQAVAIEASSHGIEQHRLDGMQLKAAAFTNLTRDHLDYHGTMEAYFEAKLALFDRILPEGSIAVVNADDPRFESIHATCKRRKIQIWGVGEKAEELKILSQIPHAAGQTVVARLWGQEVTLNLPLYGMFQVSNLLTALGLVVASGVSKEQAIAVLEKLPGVRGRMECVAIHPENAPIFVDYAHTDDALVNALKAVRKHTENKLWVVFGCGGDRDKGKRLLMGKAAEDYADEVIVTDDNPRTEEAASIRDMVMEGCPDAHEVEGRKQAIEYAISQLGAGDALLIAGKGHEQYQIIGTESVPFDDAAIAREAVAMMESDDQKEKVG